MFVFRVFQTSHKTMISFSETLPEDERCPPVQECIIAEQRKVVMKHMKSEEVTRMAAEKAAECMDKEKYP